MQIKKTFSIYQEMPGEIAKYLYSDEEMQHVYGKLSRTFNYCEGLLREWSTEYIRRLRACAMQQPPQQERWIWLDAVINKNIPSCDKSMIV